MADFTAQSEVLAFLSNPHSYGGTPAVERITTHCSSVFLVDGYAYKLKHALIFSALDYSTLEKRERACRREIALNIRTAPDLYLTVRAITRAPGGGLEFDGQGPPVDWVVVMRRFNGRDLFDAMAREGRLSAALVRHAAAELASLHAIAETTTTWGGADGVRRAIARNLQEGLKHLDLKGCTLAMALHDECQMRLTTVADLLEHRRTTGFVKRGHGDLRLANICLYKGRVTLFDGIEFSDDIGCVDTLYDLAFLLADLRRRGLIQLLDAALRQYIELTGDSASLRVMPLFMAVRLGTMAYAAAASARRQSDPAIAARRMAAARLLLRRAQKTLAEPAPGFMDGFRRVPSLAAKLRLRHQTVAEHGDSPDATPHTGDKDERRQDLTAGCDG
ncbi:hypothetical protein FBZ87_11741 [Nitrospirillum amazonense]|uniref:Aminoglycoside phosphotransferase domain-containing protein n=1 Tax=Nitrospirillum amazonense TaxID=28077 RepID=A0A560J489_9PROT|nr:phosphotransferase [Nitrospirillum amazonense]TWB65946.1 hypothetical protein FBZ87_11741 [Nitrospirillum amazonense]